MVGDAAGPDGFWSIHPPDMFERFIVLLGAIRFVLCSRADLVAEKLRLRHHAAVLARPRASAPTRSASPSGVRRSELPSV